LAVLLACNRGNSLSEPWGQPYKENYTPTHPQDWSYQNITQSNSDDQILYQNENFDENYYVDQRWFDQSYDRRQMEVPDEGIGEKFKNFVSNWKEKAREKISGNSHVFGASQRYAYDNEYNNRNGQLFDNADESYQWKDLSNEYYSEYNYADECDYGNSEKFDDYIGNERNGIGENESSFNDKTYCADVQTENRSKNSENETGKTEDFLNEAMNAENKTERNESEEMKAESLVESKAERYESDEIKAKILAENQPKINQSGVIKAENAAENKTERFQSEKPIAKSETFDPMIQNMEEIENENDTKGHDSNFDDSHQKSLGSSETDSQEKTLTEENQPNAGQMPELTSAEQIFEMNDFSDGESEDFYAKLREEFDILYSKGIKPSNAEGQNQKISSNDEMGIREAMVSGEELACKRLQNEEFLSDSLESDSNPSEKEEIETLEPLELPPSEVQNDLWNDDDLQEQLDLYWKQVKATSSHSHQVSLREGKKYGEVMKRQNWKAQNSLDELRERFFPGGEGAQQPINIYGDVHIYTAPVEGKARSSFRDRAGPSDRY